MHRSIFNDEEECDFFLIIEYRLRSERDLRERIFEANNPARLHLKECSVCKEFKARKSLHLNQVTSKDLNKDHLNSDFNLARREFFESNLLARALLPMFRLVDLCDIRLVSKAFQKVALKHILENYCINIDRWEKDKSVFITKDMIKWASSVTNTNVLNNMTNLHKIHFDNSHNTEVTFYPNSVTQLVFGESFNLPLTNLPESLIKLKLGLVFDQPISNLPDTIEVLIIGSMCYTHEITKLPASIKKLHLITRIPLKHLPDTIKKLAYQNIYSPMPNVPKELTRLTISSPMSLDDLPNTLTHITISEDFNQPIDNLPNSLRTLWIFSSRFNQPINKLPASLRNLYLSNCNYLITALPKNLHTLSLGGYCLPGNFPPHLCSLNVGNDFNQRVDNLPKTLTSLKFGFSFNQPVNNLPPNLWKLKFGCNFDHPVDDLPNQLREITFGTCFNQSICRLPDSITNICFEEYTSVDYTLYRSRFSYEFTKLPENLRAITLPKSLLRDRLSRCWPQVRTYEKKEKFHVSSYTFEREPKR